jgi:FkbM family methyltransferase
MHKLTEYVVGRSLWGGSDLRLIDVGASGGIAGHWDAFGSRLSAVGFDPLLAEVDRLNRAETREKVRYIASFVGWPEYDTAFPPAERNDVVALRYNQPFVRSSAIRAHDVTRKDYVREQFNAGAAVEYTDQTTSIDAFAAGQLPPDFVKIDTDGHDYPVLRGAEQTLRNGVLGVEVEAQFHGAVHDFANTFSNIDRFLRELGFSLFDLRPYRYSRSTLPQPFLSDIPAQTVEGQVLWAEAVYFRDLGYADYARIFGRQASREDLLKLCCLFELYGFADCAAELLCATDTLQDLSGADREELLNLVTPKVFGTVTYGEYLARFDRDPAGFYPSRIAQARAAAARDASIVPAPAAQSTDSESDRLRSENSELQARVALLQDEKARLKERLKRRGEKLDSLRARLKPTRS